MAEDLLDRVLREIRDRKRTAHAAYEESRRLEQALAALTPQRSGNAARARAITRPRGQSASPAPSQRRPRAPAGANRDAILAVVRERPGVTAAEIAQTTAIARATVSSTLARLRDAGVVERTELPSGGIGFRAAPEPGPAEPGADGQAARAEAPA